MDIAKNTEGIRLNLIPILVSMLSLDWWPTTLLTAFFTRKLNKAGFQVMTSTRAGINIQRTFCPEIYTRNMVMKKGMERGKKGKGNMVRTNMMTTMTISEL